MQQLVVVERRIKRKAVWTVETAYYISSKKMISTYYLIAIRGHWAIENGLHYTKDVSMKEDGSKIRKGNAPAIFSSVRNIAINIFRINGMKSIIQAIRIHSNDIKSLYNIILQTS